MHPGDRTRLLKASVLTGPAVVSPVYALVSVRVVELLLRRTTILCANVEYKMWLNAIEAGA